MGNAKIKISVPTKEIKIEIVCLEIFDESLPSFIRLKNHLLIRINRIINSKTIPYPTNELTVSKILLIVFILRLIWLS